MYMMGISWVTMVINADFGFLCCMVQYLLTARNKGASHAGILRIIMSVMKLNRESPLVVQSI